MTALSFGGYGLYLLLSLPALLLGFWAQAKVRSAFDRSSRVSTAAGWTGAQVARRLLDLNGLQGVAIEQVSGFLSDHYDPSKRVLRLSKSVYQGNSLASVGVAAHEAGHALQHQTEFPLLELRSAMVPTVQIGSWLGPVIFLAGLFTGGAGRVVSLAGLLLFGATAVLALITLPVEWDASRRAKKLLVSQGLIAQTELAGVSAVLNAAALTYVAAAVQAVSTIVYLGSSRTGGLK
jgi:uncharacterized protein